MEHVLLIGTEQVQSAANTMRSAASEMNRAANTISEALSEHKRVMEEFISRLNDVVNPQLDKDGNRIY